MGTQNFATCSVCDIQRPTEKFFQCSTCRPAGGDSLFYCAAHCSEIDCGHAEHCEIRGHESCWDSHLPRKGRQSHEKLDTFPDYLTRLILHSEPNSELQARLHERDRKALWFTVTSGPFEDSDATVQITDRFRRLCDPRYVNKRSGAEQYPSIVSFIGDTGVGKSTIVNAMSVMGQIDSQIATESAYSSKMSSLSTRRPSNLPQVQQARENGPVTRSGDPQRATEPTSSGVHLYLDPDTTSVRYQPSQEKDLVPILFADCEGFRGGTNKPNAERSVQGASSLSRRYSAASLVTMPSRSSSHHGRNIADELEITLPEIRNAGKAGAELYYARFLYAFSDVIVFVTNNEQQLHGDIQRLLEWAASAVHKSINHLPRKTLIIVRNMPARHNPDYYEEAFLKRSLFGSMDNIWTTSKELKAFKQHHDNESEVREGEIHSNERFLKIFFQSVEVCYIPNKGFATSPEVIRQYRSLRERIVQAVAAGQHARSVSWTRYDVPSLSHLFGRAFHHFAKMSGPFDFYKAARKDNPMSVTMADHIANLLRYLQASDLRLNGVPDIVAICLITFVHRDFRQAIEPSEVFDRTLRQVCASGIQTYQDKYQQCAFVFPSNGQRCRAVRLTHPEHCGSDAKATTMPGIFDSSDYYETPDDTIRKIRSFFIAMFTELCSHGSMLRLAPPARVAAYRRQKLTSQKLKDSSFWQNSKSSKTCFTCLQWVPDHALPCGHMYCEHCVNDFGQQSNSQRYVVEMSQCVLCLESWGTQSPQLMRMKPRCAGVRVLTLDGGGVRGIVELAILEELEQRVGLEVPVKELFDLIVGTSTGGIIALGLAMTGYNIHDMKTQFLNLSEKTFKKDRGGPLSAVDPFNVFPAILMAMKAWESKYKTTPLREGLIDLFGLDMSMFPAATTTKSQRRVRVAVTSTTSGDPCIFTNYNRLVATDDKDFEREDEQSKEARVWEAALATSAAPIYFKPLERGERGSSPKLYVDGALHANLPVDYALWEAQKIWPPFGARRAISELQDVNDINDKIATIMNEIRPDDSQSSRPRSASIKIEPPAYGGEVHLDVLVSIGTGKQTREDRYPNAFEIGGLKQVYLSFIKALDTESAWEDFMRKRSYNKFRHHRLNVPLHGSYVGLDDWKSMNILNKTVQEHFQHSGNQVNAVQDIAAQLIASLLFFEPTPPDTHLQPPDRMHRIRGQIWCRLAKESHALILLTDRICAFRYLEENVKFPNQWVPVPLMDGWKSKIRTEGEHFAIPITIKTMDPNSRIYVAVTLKDGKRGSGPVLERTFTISGFPIIFKDLEAIVTAQ